MLQGIDMLQGEMWLLSLLGPQGLSIDISGKNLVGVGEVCHDFLQLIPPQKNKGGKTTSKPFMGN